MLRYPDADVVTFADRLRWIIREDYEDEGASALLPLLALAETLDAAADVVAEPGEQQIGRLRACLTALDALR